MARDSSKNLLTGSQKPLPTPRPEKSGAFRAIFWAIVALCLVASAAWWLTRPQEKRDEMRSETADVINDLLSGTPLAGMGDLIRDAQPPPPQVVSPSTAAGTLAGRNVTGVVSVPSASESQSEEKREGFGATLFGGNSPEPPSQPTFDQNPVPQVTEDSRIRPGHLMELAQWLARRYRPGPTGGTLAMSVQSLNQVGGVQLAEKTQGGRNALLRYAFHPAMLNGLYNLYIDRFMDDLDAAATQQGMDSRQNRQFHLALAGRAALIAGALDAIMQVGNLDARLNSIDEQNRKAIDLNAQLSGIVSEMDELRSARASTQQISTMQLRVNGVSARYRRAVEELEQAQRGLVADIRQHGGQNMDNESLLFLAYWVQRRLASGGNAGAGVRSCSELLRDLARRCSEFQSS